MNPSTKPVSQRAAESTLGIGLITAERDRQIHLERFDSEHDDKHEAGALGLAAAAYALPPEIPHRHIYWPWRPRDYKGVHEGYSPRERMTELAKAGALIAAEIDRIGREHPDA